MDNIAQATEIATKAHEGQTRWGGEPYIIHPEAVRKIALKIARDFNWSDYTILNRINCIAMLHDVVEDTDVTLNDLRENFSSHVVDAVDALTQRDDVDEIYHEYIRRLSENPLAIIVKLADLEHNSTDLYRSEGRKKKNKNMYIKYQLAKMFLTEIFNGYFR